MKLALLLVVSIACTSAYGRIGETAEQLRKRYGRPLETKRGLAESQRYSFHGFSIVVGLDQGISQCEVYEKLDGSRMTEGEIWNLLDANTAEKSPWREQPEEGANNYVYRSLDKKTRVAMYILGSHKLLVTSKPFLARFAHLAGSVEQKPVEGF
jgi:hypothetical protein